MNRRLKLGTRKSLLAITQSTLIQEKIQDANPGLVVELVGIETEGDKVTDIPLSQMEGKDFFVKEIDEALLRGEIDFTVHSFKDLSLERPEGITKAAIPTRYDPRDIIIFNDNVMQRINENKPLKIGTSSPRRLENIPPFLKQALPRVADYDPRTEFVQIRGNVNTRLGRIHEQPDTERYLDGVVLAFAGLSRLMRLPHSKVQLEGLLRDTRFMVLPLTECPAAPAQGALALECRADDKDTLAALAKVHDEDTAKLVKVERDLMSQWGGGCHQRFGITTSPVVNVGPVTHFRGLKADDSYVEGIEFATPAPPTGQVKAWDGSLARSTSDPIPGDVPQLNTAVFVASAKALWSEELIKTLTDKRVWVSGTRSWFSLAQQGVWIEGCCDGYGVEYGQSTMKDPLLGLPEREFWSVLTHKGALKTWTKEKAFATYEVKFSISEEQKEELRGCTHCFWSSYSQYNACKDFVNKDAQHAAGAGKTYEMLKEEGLPVVAFPSIGSWQSWLGLKEKS